MSDSKCEYYYDDGKCRRFTTNKVNEKCRQQCRPRPRPVQLAVNAVKAVGRVLVDGLHFVPEEEKKRRIEICKSNACKLYNSNRSFCSHPSCGCCIENGLIVNKTSLATEKCPVGKW